MSKLEKKQEMSNSKQKMRREELKDVLKARPRAGEEAASGMLNYNNKTKAKKVKKAQQEGLRLHKEG